MRRVLLIAALASSATIGLQSAQAKDAVDPNKVICRDIAETGSRLSHKQICLTRDQWRQYNQDMRERLDRVQRVRTGPDRE